MTLWLDGDYLDPADARVNVADRGFLLGDGLFETMRLEAGELRRWARHEKRLTAGLDALGIAAELPSDIPALAADLANRNGLDRAVIRLTITRGSGGRGLDGASGTKPCVLMTAGALPERSAPALVLVNAPRRAPLTLAAHFKMIGYGDNVFARREARAKGGDMAVMLSPDGHVACADSANLFWVTGRTVFTPSLDTGALNGTTRAAILEECARRNLHIEEDALRPESLASAEAVLVTNALWGVMPAASLGGRALKNEHALVRLIQAIESEAE